MCAVLSMRAVDFNDIVNLVICHMASTAAMTVTTTTTTIYLCEDSE